MSAKITTKFGEAVPPAPHHSVTAHMGGWDTVESYGSNSSAVIAHFKNAYPRMRPHQDIADLSAAVIKLVDTPDTGCFLYSSLQSAKECIEYSTSPGRDNGIDKAPVPEDKTSIRSFVAKDQFFAVTFPLDKRSVVAGFWSTPGAGVSSRFAEANLERLDQLKEISVPEEEPNRESFDGLVHQKLRERIVSYLERAPRIPHLQPLPSPKDVYFFQTGMASIYKSHTYMLSLYNGSTVLFGMAFMHTITAFQEFGHSYKFFGIGTEDDIRDLEDYLVEEHSHGRKVQAIWAEFPANPLLVTPNLTRLRELADDYDVVLAIDDTIGSWSNIDITDMTDLLVTSVTKSFNGYADVIAGSAILNPASRKYKDLKQLFDKFYVPELYIDDAKAIEKNSRDYLTRTTKLNGNASAIVEYLHSCAQDPSSAVRQVHYPSINPSGEHYKRYMRTPTDDFTPGYGCLFNVDLDDLATTRAFYDNLNVHKSVHLGAPFTLAFAYTICTYKKKLDWAAEYNMRPTQIRISAGLEDTALLLEDFRIAVEAANKTKTSQGQDDS
ncbi:Cystathionine gamma-synthase converts cysteine into cystathionine [Fusarium albosuccineum]|uniref:Cystathionine gamma-synthase converts cysteine into cystathionine n=1 Tax=Fusarium albosuccineum TaxID=1237068 RepID=A0A8H4L3Z6_9HYPO|nr:Cystathionine gamma-synthase converts cysteine into cystathionine [Fusarium albosuccineum]